MRTLRLLLAAVLGVTGIVFVSVASWLLDIPVTTFLHPQAPTPIEPKARPQTHVAGPVH